MSISARKPSIAFAWGAALATLAALAFASPLSAAPKVDLPGENINAPVVDNPLITNNGEGHDLDDIEELQEHWRKPEYLIDQHRQIAGIAIFCTCVAGFGFASRIRIQARYDRLKSAG